MSAEQKRSHPNAIKGVLTLVIKQISRNDVKSRKNDSNIYTPHASTAYLSSYAFLAIEPADQVLQWYSPVG